MKSFWYTAFKAGGIVMIFISLCLLSGEALAAETAPAWRPVYDMVMRYINFLILLFLLLKYGRKPLVNFFRTKSRDVKKDIQKIEEARSQIQGQVTALLAEQEKSRERFEQLKERIISQGKIKQKGIIDGARREAELLLENTQLKLDNLIIKATHTLRSEMVDIAMDLAVKKLPQTITDQDNRRFVNHYLESTRSLHPPS